MGDREWPDERRGCCGRTPRPMPEIVLVASPFAFLGITWLIGSFMDRRYTAAVVTFGYAGDGLPGSPASTRAVSGCLYGCLIVGFLMTFKVCSECQGYSKSD